MITPSGPTTDVILIVNMGSISELTIHSVYVHPVCVKEMYNTSFMANLIQQIVQLVLKDDLEIALLSYKLKMYSFLDMLTPIQK